MNAIGIIDRLLAVVGEREMPMTEIVTDGLRENVPGGGLLVVAYGIIVALVLGYVVRMATTQRRIGRELEELERQASKPGPGGGPGAESEK